MESKVQRDIASLEDEDGFVPDSVKRMSAVESATAVAPEGESHKDFMTRVTDIYEFLCTRPAGGGTRRCLN